MIALVTPFMTLPMKVEPPVSSACLHSSAMKSVMKSRTTEDIRQRHREQIAQHLGGGTFEKFTKM